MILRCTRILGPVLAPILDGWIRVDGSRIDEIAAGEPPAVPEAVATSTRAPAHVLGLHLVGRLEPGCRADIVALTDEPELDFVWHGGALVR